MSGRVKHVEVNSARNRLDATLQSLVEKKDDGHEVLFDSDGESELVVHTGIDGTLSESPVSSPSKRIMGPRSKKRKRKDDVIEADSLSGAYHHTYVMKLFDRSVDLAQFDEDTALYPIARAWITNKPYKRGETKDRSPSPDHDPSHDEGIEALTSVYSMPAPIKQEAGMLHRDHRIPNLIPSTEKPLDIHMDPDKGPPPEELLLRHMDRWKRIRNSWIDASRVNEARYQPSMALLKEMFDQ